MRRAGAVRVEAECMGHDGVWMCEEPTRVQMALSKLSLTHSPSQLSLQPGYFSHTVVIPLTVFPSEEGIAAG